jgi:L-iditol 2-dehydrogenase
MRAAVYRGIDDVRIEDVPIPEIGAGEVLIRVHSCGVCSTDLKKIHYGLVPPPRIFGHEIAGTIVALGPQVIGWNVGDRVVVMHHVPCLACHYCRHHSFAQCPTYKKTGTTAGFEPAGGGFAEYVRVMDWIVARGMVRIPENVHFDEATFVEPVNTCLKAVKKAGVKPGSTVLVIGQGPIGLLFTQLLCRQGALVYGSDCLPYRLEFALRFGATAVFQADSQDVFTEVKLHTEGRGADLAIVTAANNAVIPMAFKAVRPGGKVLLFAQTRLGDPLQVDAGAICMLEKDLIGSYSADITLQEEAAKLVFGRMLNVADLITHAFPLEKVNEALAIASAPRENSLKVMVHA